MPRSKIIGSAPILLVKDVIASANYYRDKVGFNYERFWGEPPGFCILYRDGFHLMLKQVEDEKYVVPHYKAAKDMWNIYFWVDDADKLYEELINLGAKIDYELCDQPYGCREFGIQDLDGYDIAFGQDTETTLLCEPGGSRIEPPGDAARWRWGMTIQAALCPGHRYSGERSGPRVNIQHTRNQFHKEFRISRS